MPENPEVKQDDYTSLVKRMRETAHTVHRFDLDRGLSPKSGLMTVAILDLRQGANTIEDLLRLEERGFYDRFNHALTKALFDFILGETGWQPHFSWEPHTDPGTLLQVTCGDHGPLDISMHIQIERGQFMPHPF